MAPRPDEDRGLIASLEEHLGERRSAIAAIADEPAVRRRGHYTPGDEEAILAAWGDCWRTRAALFEMIVEETDDPATFCRAFAAALVLIASARGLRDRFHGDAILRRKLNEPVDSLAIPVDAYDTVQRSLLRARHHARIAGAVVEYEAMVAAGRIDPAWREFIAGRLGCLTVPGRRLVTSYLRTRFSRLRAKIGRHGLGRAGYRIQTWFGIAAAEIRTRRGHRPRLPAHVDRALRGHLRPGDVMVTRKEHVLTNHLLPGYWPHAILYRGDARVIEAQRDGVRDRGLDEAFGCDGIVVLRPRCAPEDIARALARAATHIGKAYDFDFDFTRGDRLVCSEVVYRAFDGTDGLDLAPSKRYGRFNITAQEFVEAALDDRWFDLVAARLPGGELAVGDAAREVVGARLKAEGLVVGNHSRTTGPGRLAE